MPAVLLRFRADLRGRWRAWVGMALIVGLFGGVVMAAVAGARRTESSFNRFLEATKAPQMFVSNPPGELSETFARVDFAKVAKAPGVAETGRAAGYAVIDPPELGLLAPADDAVGGTFFLRKMLAGREPRADRPDEVTISFVTARAQHLGVGDHLRLVLPVTGPGGEPEPTPFRFHIVGIDAAANEFPPQVETGVQTVWATPAFYRAHLQDVLSYDALMVRLRNGTKGVPAVMNTLRELSGGRPVQVFALADQAVNTQRSIHLQAVALWMLAGLLAAASLLVLTQLLLRQSALESADYPALSALGMSRTQLWTSGMLRGGLVGLIGAALAGLVAFLLSPALPVGLARTAEPHPGLAFDATTVGLGALATALLVVLTTAWPSWRAARAATANVFASEAAGQGRRSSVADALARASAPAPVTAGVRLALEPGRGRTAVPVRTTALAAIVGIAALATALAFTASLSDLLHSPRRYGVSWDARVVTISTEHISPAIPVVMADKHVADVAAGYSGFPATIRDERVNGIAMRSVRGSSLMPTPVVGRLPKGPAEIMLGSKTMRALHAHVGQTLPVTIAEAGQPIPYRVVGAGVFPSLADGMGLGKGVALNIEGLARVIPGGSPPPPDTVLVRFKPGVDQRAATSELNRGLSGLGIAAASPDKPVDLLNFGGVQNLPVLLAGLLGGLAAATLAHLLVTSIRRRRRDLAILKTLGFASQQVRSTVAWQATTLSVLALVVGIPLGVAAGRWVWILFAHELGIAPVPAIPTVTLAVLAGATLVVCNLVALLPARAAARVRPALVLRSE